MSKLIIHNKTNLSDDEILFYVRASINEIHNNDYKDFADFTFYDNIKVQFYKQKTCNTFYVYGRRDIDGR